MTVSGLFLELSWDEDLTKIDFSKGYWPILVANEDVHKTVFVMTDDTFEYLKMTFGMLNPEATPVHGMKRLGWKRLTVMLMRF